MSNNSTTQTLPADNQIKQNDWAVASAAQFLLGKVSPNALAVAIALAAHVPFDGAELKVWPSWPRLMFMCGIRSKVTLSRVLQELEQHGLIEVGRKKDRRKSHVYILHYVTVPQHVIERTLRAIEKASKVRGTETVPQVENRARSVENPKVRGTESGPRRGTETVPESYQPKYLNKEREEEGRGRHDPPPRNDAKTIVSHPLSRSFEAKAPHLSGEVSEFIEPTKEARRAWARQKILETAGPAAVRRMEEREGEKDLVRVKTG